MKFFILLFLFGFSDFVSGFKILYFNPKFGKSHVTFNGKVADTLAAAGHDVVVYQPIVNDKIKGTGSFHKNVRYYFKPKNESAAVDADIENQQDMIWEQDGISKLGPMVSRMYLIKNSYCKEIMNDEENLSKLRKENFDLGISELFESCGFGVFHAIGLKKVIAAHGGSMFAGFGRILGIPVASSFQPAVFSDFPSKMNFFQRVLNFVSLIIEAKVSDIMILDSAEDAIREKYPEFSLVNMVKESAFFFINTDEVVDYVCPMTSKVIHIGGLGKVQSKPLEKKYQEIFNSSKKGVVYFSFGSVAQSYFMPEAHKKAFLGAFAEFPDISFIWKYERESDQIAKGYKNVFTFDWLPQNEILEHEKLLAFISHGGMNSVTEGASKGVPMICIPIFADQPHNAKMLEQKGTAIVINKNDITKETIVAAIKKIIENPEFKEKARMISKMIQAKPMTSEEKVVKYAEFAAQFGDTGVLQSEGRHLSFIQLYSIDVVAFLALIITVITYGLFRLVKRILCIFFRVSHQKQE